MKKLYLFTFILMVAIFEINAQIAINKDGSAPHSSAMLDIKASGTTNAKGFLMPRVADHSVITAPAKGLMVFNTTTNSAWMYNGTAWAEMSAGSAGNGWILKNDTLYADNKKVGINTAAPKTTLEVQGDGFLVSQKTIVTTADPNLRVFNFTPYDYGYGDGPFPFEKFTEEAGILYDSGGPSAPYSSNKTNYAVTIAPANANLVGIKLTFEAFDTEANGDSIIIYRTILAVNQYVYEVLAKYSGNTRPPDFFYSSDSTTAQIIVQFKTNGNSVVGQGFKIKWQSLNSSGNSTPITGIVGNSAYFETTKGAFRSGNRGRFNKESPGVNSTAMGYACQALGDYSTAMGYNALASSTGSFAAGFNARATGDGSVAIGSCRASGSSSVAIGGSIASAYYAVSIGDGCESLERNSTSIGNRSRATGENSVSMGAFNNALGFGSVAIGYVTRTGKDAQYATAMGYRTNASSTNSFAVGAYTTAAGESSTAMGNSTNAFGDYSTSMGFNTTAGGAYSTAIGSNVNANSEGSIVIGDSKNGSSTMLSPNSNTFAARFRNGYYLYSNANSSAGVVLSGGGNSWSTVSDSTKKENFQEIDGEKVLKRIANMRTVTWNYKGQDSKRFRHYGPMAQEFFSAFGRDKLGVIGNDTTIASADFDGVNFTAIKALEKRTAELQTENENLKKRLAILEKSSSEIMVLKAEMEQLKAFLLPEKEKIRVKVASEK